MNIDFLFVLGVHTNRLKGCFSKLKLDILIGKLI